MAEGTLLPCWGHQLKQVLSSHRALNMGGCTINKLQPAGHQTVYAIRFFPTPPNPTRTPRRGGHESIVPSQCPQSIHSTNSSPSRLPAVHSADERSLRLFDTQSPVPFICKFLGTSNFSETADVMATVAASWSPTGLLEATTPTKNPRACSLPSGNQS